MALPIKKAADLAKDMASKGVMGSISMGEPKDDGEMPEDDGMDAPDHVKPVLADIDALVPGLGKLMLELCEKMKADDQEQDKEDTEAY